MTLYVGSDKIAPDSKCVKMNFSPATAATEVGGDFILLSLGTCLDFHCPAQVNFKVKKLNTKNKHRNRKWKVQSPALLLVSLSIVFLGSLMRYTRNAPE